VILSLALQLAGAAVSGAPADSLRAVQVGEVRVVASGGRIDAAIALAELADRATVWPGLGRRTPGAFQLVLVADSAELARVTRGRAPGWGAAVAFPASRTIILRADLPDLPRTLRHEIGHLVLRSALRSRVPLWFDEGYATLAAGEFDRLARLEMHLSVVLRGVPTLRDLDGELRSSAAVSERAYGLAATAVGYLAERIPGGELTPLLDRLAAGEGFEEGVAAVTGHPLARLEEDWRETTRKRFRGALWLAAGGWWLVAAGVVALAWGLRKRRERPRREALDAGWEVPPEGEGASPPEGSGAPPIDPTGKGL
jgi:hypothetical protein